MTTLFTTKAELDALLSAADKSRKSGGTVKVPRDALQHVVMDHHKMFSLCKAQVIEPAERA